MKKEWNNDTATQQISEFPLSIIPVSSQKIPFEKWNKYQSTTAPVEYWHNHFQNKGTVGIIGGWVSQNTECIDIDIKNDPNRTIIDEYTKLIPAELYKRLIVQTTPSGGQHFIYRCTEAIIEQNLKLALHSDKTVIIETRGEGGYFCTNKIYNKILQGKFDLAGMDVEIPVITKAERELLLETARSLTRYFPFHESKNGKPYAYSENAINDFNYKYSALDLFTKHGWSVVNEDDKKYYLLRDGSSAPHSGYYFKDTKTFFCFSTSTPFKPEKPYNNFQVLQVLEGKDDYRTTLRLLPALGFPVKDKPDKVSSDDIANYLNGLGVRYDSFIQDLTMDGKIIEEMDYNTIYINLKKHFEKEIPRTRFEEVIKSHYIATINPVLDFIDANKERKPEGTFEQWLDCLELKNESIDKSVVLLFLKKWYVGMIAQSLDGEFPNEWFLTLISTEQGIGKTTFLRTYTLPKQLHAYRKEHSLSFDDDFKVIMSQSLLVIDDEMDGRTYEADKTFKNILSNKELTMRRKYDRRISTLKRRCSFAGSGNNLFVVREQRNRRIIPLEIKKVDYEKLKQVDLTDLFMEAYWLFESGFKYSYQREDMELLKRLDEDYLQKSDVDLVFEDVFDLPESDTDQYHITVLDAVNTLSFNYPQFSKRINVVVLGKLMAENGYRTVRKGKKKTTYFVISNGSKIIPMLNSDSQSTYERWVG